MSELGERQEVRVIQKDGSEATCTLITIGVKRNGPADASAADVPVELPPEATQTADLAGPPQT